MAYKKTTRKTSGGAKMTTTNHTSGHKRETHTVKPTKSLTISRSRNPNGTIKTTTTNTINGWTTRKTKTSGTGVVKSPRIRTPKVRSGGRRSSKGDAIFITLVFAAVVGIFWAAWKGIELLFATAQESVRKPETEELDKKVWYYTKVFLFFCLYLWIAGLLVYWSFVMLGKML